MYCKKCNVKLTSSNCPLCGYKVDEEDTNNSYSSTIEKLPYNLGLVYSFRITILVLVIGTIVTMICNLAISKQLTWSLIVIFSTLYFSTHYLYMTMEHKVLAFIINVISLELLLGSIAYISSWNWYIYLVMPLILLISINFLLYLWISKSHNMLRNMSMYLFLIGLFIAEINGICNLYKEKVIYLTWSYNITLVIIIISLVLYLLSFNKKIKEEVDKRFFV